MKARQHDVDMVARGMPAPQPATLWLAGVRARSWWPVTMWPMLQLGCASLDSGFNQRSSSHLQHTQLLGYLFNGGDPLAAPRTRRKGGRDAGLRETARQFRIGSLREQVHTLTRDNSAAGARSGTVPAAQSNAGVDREDGRCSRSRGRTCASVYTLDPGHGYSFVRGRNIFSQLSALHLLPLSSPW
jgi:hypothetical protein